MSVSDVEVPFHLWQSRRWGTRLLSCATENMPPRPLRVAQILPYPGVGGTEHATLRIVEAIATRGFESIAFCLSTAHQVIEFFRDAGVEVATWEPRQPRRGERAGFVLHAARLAWELRRQGVDLVHCADVPAASWGPAPAGWLARKPVICHIHNRHPGLEYFNLPGLRAVHQFVFVSQATWRDFAVPVPPARGRVIYNGVPAPQQKERSDVERVRVEVRREFGLPDGVKLIGMVARVEPQKDFVTLARAAARVLAAEPDGCFLIVGGTESTAEQREHYPRVRQALEQNGVASRFLFTGLRSDVDRLLHALDVFVLSTHHEGLPLALVEAMLRDIPVVATAVDGIPEIIEEDITGRLVPHQDDAAMAAMILSLLADPLRARAMGRAGAARARAVFSEERFAGEICGLYDEVLAAHGRAWRSRAPGSR